MKKTATFCALFILAIVALSCKKEKNNNTASKTVKYEIKGNFTGQLLIIINDNVNGNTVLNNVSLPWSVEKTYPSNISGIGIGGQSTVRGSVGQTAELKIYVDNNVVKTANLTTDATGGLIVPTLAHTLN